MSITGYNPATVSTLTTGTYRHVALSISGTWHTLYLDGSMVAQNLSGGNIFTAYSSLSNLYIGCAGDLSYGYTGFIDDFKIWNRALPATDVSLVYWKSGWNRVLNGLVAYWPFDTTTTESIFGYTPTVYGSPTISNTTYAVGSGSLNCTNTGTSPFLSYTNASGLLPIASGYTISLWFYSTAMAPANVYPTIFTITNSNNQFIGMYFNNNSLQLLLTIRNSENTGSVFSSGQNMTLSNLNINTWYHIVVAFPTGVSGVSTNVTYWLNGNITTPAAGGSISSPVPAVNRTNIFINNANATNTYFIPCYIDDLRLYNRILSNTEVTSLYTPPIDRLSSTTQTAMLGTGKSAGAYGTKLLYSGYTGPIMNIRNATTTTTADFYADVYGNLGTGANGTGTSLATWLNGAVAQIVTWYDQTGNARHATGSTGNYPTLSNATITTIASNTIPPTGYYVSFNTTGTSYSYFSLPDNTLPYGNTDYSYVTKTYIVKNAGSPYGVSLIGGGTHSNDNNYTGIDYEYDGRYRSFSWNSYDYFTTGANVNVNHINEVATMTYNSTNKRRYGYITYNNTTTSLTGTVTNIPTRVQSNTNNYMGLVSNSGFNFTSSNNLYGASKIYYMYVLPIDLQSYPSDRAILEAT